ncbi:Predicted kinase, aminoglycoside phosphotransferase (APT) family [Glycomyces sambucus]|uniref:Predicted kinase, aminoglycoside phosphotransferase (APT) family n=2 Tax=Glycomyces sambucus TaxID=380244 RepID=A0A1G9CL31_9ACTN|nr:aminoglycoside phosphotransferase family protein [Glycomyces sambucus]SDK52377.1 Predicted kinase, aminoglycoside phosphotransferase (APT) family [Glycomyces sambucus]
MQMHEDQLTVPVAAVRELIDAQFPRWRGLPVAPVAMGGTVNAIFRVGDGLTARFPLQPGDPAGVRAWLESEAEAARELLGRTRFPSPEPRAIGEPGAGYPLPWSVQTWVPGTTADEADPGASEWFARDLAEFITGVRAIPTEGRVFSGGGRGGVIAAHGSWMETCFRESAGLLDVPALRRLWAEMRDLPRGGDPDVMCHGDLIPGNVLVRDGRLAGVLDVGGLGPADPALDLVGAWHLLDAGPRAVLRGVLGCGDAEWDRGRAWAFVQAMGVVWYYAESNPAMSRWGRRTLARTAAD